MFSGKRFKFWQKRSRISAKNADTPPPGDDSAMVTATASNSAIETEKRLDLQPRACCEAAKEALRQQFEQLQSDYKVLQECVSSLMQCKTRVNELQQKLTEHASIQETEARQYEATLSTLVAYNDQLSAQLSRLYSVCLQCQFCQQRLADTSSNSDQNFRFSQRSSRELQRRPACYFLADVDDIRNEAVEFMADDNYEQYSCDVSDACAEQATIVYHASADAIGSPDHVTMTTAGHCTTDDEKRKSVVSSSSNHMTAGSEAPSSRYSGLFVDVGGDGMLSNSCQTSTMSLNDILDMDAVSVDSLSADVLRLSDGSSLASSQWTAEFEQLCRTTSVSIPSVSDSDDIVDVEMSSRLKQLTFDGHAADQPVRGAADDDDDDKRSATAGSGVVADDVSVRCSTSTRSDDGESVFADQSSPSSGSIVIDQRGCTSTDTTASDAHWLIEPSQSLASASPSCSTDDGYWTHSPVSVRVTTDQQDVFDDDHADNRPLVTTLPTAEEQRIEEVTSAVVSAANDAATAIDRLCNRVQLSGTNDVGPAVANTSVTKDMVGALTAYFESIHSEFHRPDVACPQCQSSLAIDVTSHPPASDDDCQLVVADSRPSTTAGCLDNQCDVDSLKLTCDHSATSPTSPVDYVTTESDALQRDLSSRRVVSLPNVSSDAISGRMSTSSASSVLSCHVTAMRSHSLQSFDGLLTRVAAERRKLRSSDGDVAMTTTDTDPNPRLTPDMIMKYTIQGYRNVPDAVKRTATAIVYPIGMDRKDYDVVAQEQPLAWKPPLPPLSPQSASSHHLRLQTFSKPKPMSDESSHYDNVSGVTVPYQAKVKIQPKTRLRVRTAAASTTVCYVSNSCSTPTPTASKVDRNRRVRLHQPIDSIQSTTVDEGRSTFDLDFSRSSMTDHCARPSFPVIADGVARQRLNHQQQQQRWHCGRPSETTGDCRWPTSTHRSEAGLVDRNYSAIRGGAVDQWTRRDRRVDGQSRYIGGGCSGERTVSIGERESASDFDYVSRQMATLEKAVDDMRHVRFDKQRARNDQQNCRVFRY